MGNCIGRPWTVVIGRLFYLQAYKDSGHANPLGQPFLISLVYRFFGYHESFWLARIPSLVAAALIVSWAYYETGCRNKRGTRNFYYFSLIVVLHPMIVAFSTSATTDIMTVGLLLASLSLLNESRRNSSNGCLIGAAFLFGLSSIVKYITPVFSVAVIVIFLSFKKSNTAYQARVWIRFLLFVVISVLVLLAEISWKWKYTGVFLSTGVEGMKPQFLNVPKLLSTLVKYVSFLGLFAGALPLFFTAIISGPTKIFRARVAIFLMAALSIGWIQSKPLGDGELDFGGGFLFGEIANRALQTFGFMNGVVLLLILFRRIQSGDVLRKALIISLGPYLILLSASRPTQRYLIYAIPIVLLILVETLDELPKKVRYFAVGSTALGFAAVSLLGMSYLTSQGNASEEMAAWVEENNLISQTSAGAIGPHAGQHFWGINTTELRYEIIAVTPATESQVQERILHREPMKVLGKVTRVYLLRELPNAP